MSAPQSDRPTQRLGILTGIERLLDRHYGNLPAFLIPLQLFLGAGWLRAAISNGSQSDWWSGGYLENFLIDQTSTIPWYRAFLDFAVEPL
ncbi:MAG: hypothetical protein HKN07_12410, partial [Acidimicrobiia bacterium]|nr:hypothetical protein [Acidimicrobiia bacterium]